MDRGILSGSGYKLRFCSNWYDKPWWLWRFPRKDQVVALNHDILGETSILGYIMICLIQIFWDQFWDISWYTSSRLAWFVGCFCAVSWQRQAWLYYSFLGTQATGKAMWKIRTQKEISRFSSYRIYQTWQTWVHICSQLHCMQTYLDIFVWFRMHLLLNSGFMIWFVIMILL